MAKNDMSFEDKLTKILAQCIARNQADEWKADWRELSWAEINKFHSQIKSLVVELCESVIGEDRSPHFAALRQAREGIAIENKLRAQQRTTLAQKLNPKKGER